MEMRFIFCGFYKLSFEISAELLKLQVMKLGYVFSLRELGLVGTWLAVLEVMNHLRLKDSKYSVKELFWAKLPFYHRVTIEMFYINAVYVWDFKICKSIY